MASTVAAAVVALHIAITAATLQSLPHTTVSATDEKGHTDQYGGVSLRDLLTQQSVPAGHDVHGSVRVREVTAIAVEDAPSP